MSYHKAILQSVVKPLVIFQLIILPRLSFSQIDSLKTLSLDVEMMVLDQEKVKKELNDFLQDQKIIPDKLDEYQTRFNARFSLSEASYFTFVVIMEKWGAIQSRKMASVNYTKRLASIDEEIQQLEKEKSEYESLLKQIEIQSASYAQYWERLELTKTELRQKNRLRTEWAESDKKFDVALQVSERNYLSTEPDFSFVNMPGIQFSYLLPANSADGLYPEAMVGYGIKYLMNRRKTYLELGLFQAVGENQSVRYDELYKFGIGQDFYSAHLGRGTRRSFNLYSGFNLGVFILTGDEENITSWYVTPSIGLEIFKSKNILLETKMGYFLPFRENRNMRGFLLDASFNIVF
ncbi:MAG: hypothetical protein AAF206_10080 [Bacteroidota bacterium]